MNKKMNRTIAKRRRRSARSSKFKVILSVLIIIVGLCMFALTLAGLSQPIPMGEQVAEENHISHEEFIQQIAVCAKEMHKEFGILPSIIIGQAILESDWGRSQLSEKYNNLFGIKSFDPNLPSIYLLTKEHKDGKWIEIKDYFRVYDSWEDSIRDHTLLFVNGVDWDRYLYQGVLLASDYKTAAKALEAAGYATDPDYAAKIIEVIQAHQLYKFDPPAD